MLQTTATKWVNPQTPSPEDESLATALSTRFPFPISLAHILRSRDVHTLEQAKAFFKPSPTLLHDPYRMRDMDKAVERISQARDRGEKVLVYGDYDVDGTTSVALLTLFLESWQVDFDFYIPDRYTEGYGLSEQGVAYAKAQGASVLLCLDCGIKAISQVELANQAPHSLDVIICDHHKPGNTLPAAHAVLDPLREDCDYPEAVLSGCGVGFKLCEALDAQWRAEAPESAPAHTPFEAYADLVTLSIASDLVPITGENRIIAAAGLEKLKTNPLKGIAAIMHLCKTERTWTISDLVFFIGPHINAAGRLHHAKHAVDVLRGKVADLIDLAQDLEGINSERKVLDQQITREALHLMAADPHFAERKATVLFQPEWHKGVIGIVASRLIEEHYRPTILFTQTEDKLVGSARSVSGFNVYDAIDACRDHVIQFGGHAYAAGITMKPNAFPAFAQAFEDYVARTITPAQRVPSLHLDAEIQLHELDDRFLRRMNLLAPFGPGNRRPVFLARGVEVTDARAMKEKHLRLTVKQGGRVFSAIGFNLYPRWQMVNALHIDLAFQPVFHTWNNKTSIDLQLKDIRPAS